MSWQGTVLSIPILLALVVSLFLCGYILSFYRDGRRDALVVLYFWITVTAIIWTGFSALKLMHTDPATKLVFYRFLHIGAAFLPPLMFLFAVAFTDRTRWLRYETIGAVFLFPVVFVGLLFFHPGELVIAGTQLVENDIVILRVLNGPVFTLFLSYSTLLVLATLVIILLEIRRFGPAYYPQASLIAVAVITPIVFALLTAAGIPPFADDRINLVPTSAAVSIGAFGVLLYRYRLVDLPPLAYVTAMKYSPDALFVLDKEGRVIHTNKHGSGLLDAVGGSLEASLFDVFSTFDPASTSNELVEITHSTGEVTYHRVFVEPLNRGGRRVGWVVVLRDETEQQRQQKKLQQKNAQMELFASTISHDLRNPLSVAKGYLQIVRDEYSSEELDRIDTAHTRMEEIIEEVLTLTRAGRQIDTLEAVPLSAVIDNAWESVTTRSGELSVEIDRSIKADPTMIQHVFENLFRNAVEHGGEDVTVTVGPLDTGFFVEDDGAGIAPHERDDVFEPGYSTSRDGTGLGMSIIEQIIDAHEWEIRLTEGTDGGVRFEITGVEFDE